MTVMQGNVFPTPTDSMHTITHTHTHLMPGLSLREGVLLRGQGGGGAELQHVILIPRHAYARGCALPHTAAIKIHAGLPACAIRPLQLSHPAAAQLLFKLPR